MIQDRATGTILFIGLAVSGVIIGRAIAGSPDDTVALLTLCIVAFGALLFAARTQEDRRFVVRLFLIALAVRVLVAGVSYQFDVRGIIAPDFGTYDNHGNELYKYWTGQLQGGFQGFPFTRRSKSGWGFYYFVAGVYYLIGRNTFAFQLICCVLGAAAAVFVNRIAYMIYPDQGTARLAGMLAAISPTMIIWTSQGIKEGPITFLLCMSLYLTLRMSRKITIVDSLLLLGALFCIFALRHYVFYVVLMAVVGSLVVAAREFSAARLMQGGLLIIVLGVVFSSLGAQEVAEGNLNLKRIQAGREWSARVSNTGYGGDVDITDTREAITYLPIGAMYFLYAPFPWMISSVSHVLSLPELVLWWLAAPLLFAGYWYMVRHRLRESFPVCIFTIGLTLVYALYQTNAGTSHRQRVQLLGFFLIFIAIAWTRWRAARAERRAQHAAARYGWTGAMPAGPRALSR